MSINLNRAVKRCGVLSIIIITALLVYLPLAYATESEPSKVMEEQEAKEGVDILRATAQIITYFANLIKEFKNMLPQDRYFTETQQEKIDNLDELLKNVKDNFGELTGYLAKVDYYENEEFILESEKERKELDEFKVEKLVDKLRYSLKDFLNEAHYVLDEYFASQISESLTKIKARRITQKDLLDFKDYDELIPQVKIGRSLNNIEDIYLSSIDPKDTAAFKKYKDLLMAVNEILKDLN